MSEKIMGLEQVGPKKEHLHNASELEDARLDKKHLNFLRSIAERIKTLPSDENSKEHEVQYQQILKEIELAMPYGNVVPQAKYRIAEDLIGMENISDDDILKTLKEHNCDLSLFDRGLFFDKFGVEGRDDVQGNRVSQEYWKGK
jgi:hypothetical protein